MLLTTVDSGGMMAPSRTGDVVMRNILPRLELWLLMRLLRREAMQGSGQFHDPTRLYVLIREAWADAFTEDNEATINAYLRECFEKSEDETAAKKRQADREALISRLSKYERELLGV